MSSALTIAGWIAFVSVVGGLIVFVRWLRRRRNSERAWRALTRHPVEFIDG